MSDKTLQPLMVSASGAAALIGVSRSKFYEMLGNRCPVQAIKFGKRSLFRVADLESWVAGGCRSDWRAGKCK